MRPKELTDKRRRIAALDHIKSFIPHIHTKEQDIEAERLRQEVMDHEKRKLEEGAKKISPKQEGKTCAKACKEEVHVDGKGEEVPSRVHGEKAEETR